MNNFEIPEEALKKIKTQAEFDEFFKELYKQAKKKISKTGKDDVVDNNKKNTPVKKKKSTAKKRDILQENKASLEIIKNRNVLINPKVVLKHQLMSTQIEQSIITMHSLGMSSKKIKEAVSELYGIEVNETSISNITSHVLDDVKQWQQRPLEDVYFVIWLDGITFKVRENGKVSNKTVFLAIGVNKDGMKEVLGMWINDTENASLWKNILTDLKNRGVEDILIACANNITDIGQAIKPVFPETVPQLCIIHQIRNSYKYVFWKDKKQFMSDLKAIYGAKTQQAALNALNEFEAKWGEKYGYAIKSWRDNWKYLSDYFEYPIEVRTMLSNTNIIDNLYTAIRKYSKAKTVLPDDQTILKSVYLAISTMHKKWIIPVRNWGAIFNRFIIKFGNRCRH